MWAISRCRYGMGGVSGRASRIYILALDFDLQWVAVPQRGGRACGLFVVDVLSFSLILTSSLHGAGVSWECDRRGCCHLPLPRQEERTESSAGTWFYSASLLLHLTNNLCSTLQLLLGAFRCLCSGCVEVNFTLYTDVWHRIGNNGCSNDEYICLVRFGLVLFQLLLVTGLAVLLVWLVWFGMNRKGGC